MTIGLGAVAGPRQTSEPVLPLSPEQWAKVLAAYVKSPTALRVLNASKQIVDIQVKYQYGGTRCLKPGSANGVSDCSFGVNAVYSTALGLTIGAGGSSELVRQYTESTPPAGFAKSEQTAGGQWKTLPGTVCFYNGHVFMVIDPRQCIGFDVSTDHDLGSGKSSAGYLRDPNQPKTDPAHESNTHVNYDASQFIALKSGCKDGIVWQFNPSHPVTGCFDNIAIRSELAAAAAPPPQPMQPLIHSVPVDSQRVATTTPVQQQSTPVKTGARPTWKQLTSQPTSGYEPKGTYSCPNGDVATLMKQKNALPEFQKLIVGAPEVYYWLNSSTQQVKVYTKKP